MLPHVEPIIDIRDFSFAVRGTAILRGVTLAVGAGEYVSVIGPNGAGKTTLLKCLMRIHEGGMGVIRIGGRKLEHYRQRKLARMISYVPQSDGRFLPFTVAEYVMLGRYPYLSPFTTVGPDDRRSVAEALDITGASGIASRHMMTLSGGERQIAAMAAALAQGAPIMLLDEPTTFLDPRHEADVLAVMERINRERGITILTVTHNINHAALFSDRVGVMGNGRFVFIGPPADLMSNDVLSPVYDRRFTFVPHPDTGFPVIMPEGRRT